MASHTRRYARCPGSRATLSLALGLLLTACLEPRPETEREAGAGGPGGAGRGGAGGGGIGGTAAVGGGGVGGGFTSGLTTGGAGGDSGAGGVGGFAPPAGGFLARPAVTAGSPPPPLSGGTLLVLTDGVTALAADPDRDRLYFADLDGEKLLASVALQAGDEPGRAVEDATGSVHVVLRRAGAIVSLTADRTVRERRPVCPAPRGIAYQRETSALHVACAGGELITLPAAGGAPMRTIYLDRDLRDVVSLGDRLFVSRFRTGELLVVSATSGALIERRSLPGSPASQRLVMGPGGATPAAIPGVAWRMRLLSDESLAVLHQESSSDPLLVGAATNGYGSSIICPARMAAAISRFSSKDTWASTGAQLSMAPLPIDFAESRDGRLRALVLAGNTTSSETRTDPVYLGVGSAVFATWREGTGGESGFNGGAGGGAGAGGAGGSAGSGGGGPLSGCTGPVTGRSTIAEAIEFRQPAGDAIALDFDGRGRVVVQTREPARLEILSHRGGTIKLADDSRFDSGHGLFHLATSSGLACASCHPEGGDDARTWWFAGIGLRRTQSLYGGITGTAPFHWDGDMPDLGYLMLHVFSSGMGGPGLTDDHVAALGKWLDRLPAPAPSAPRNPAAVDRGRALFNDAAVGCATCHGGPRFSNNQTVAVGTGKPFQVAPLLGVGGRPPYMHDGCAATLRERFTSSTCGGGDMHGKTSQLTAGQIDDLVAYLESL